MTSIKYWQHKILFAHRLKSILCYLAFVLMVLFTTNTVAQVKTFKVSGFVIDTKGLGLPGANVVIKGTNKAVMTDIDGKYSISVPDQQTVLVISFTGFKSKEVVAKSANGQAIPLSENATSLDEVVVIGYGTTTKKDLTGSVGRVSMDDLKKAPVTSFDQALAGRIAGVQVTSNDGQPGAGSQFAIRGNSISQDASPLFVIDGFPTENMDLNSINMNDVESISVLKDASSIAIYGARGAAGVVIITTKRGTEGPVKFNYSTSIAYQNDVNRIEVLSPYEFVKLMVDLDQQESTPTVPVTRYSALYLDPANGKDLNYYKTVKGIDWADKVLQLGQISNHSLSMTGGSKETKFSFSGSYTDQKGIIVNTGMRRLGGKMTFDHKLSKSVRLGVIANYTNTSTFGTIPNAGNGGGVVYNMWGYRPVSGLSGSDLEGAPIDDTVLQDVASGSTVFPDNLVNPYQQAMNEYRKNITNTANLNSFLEYSFWKNFKLKVSGGLTSTNVKSDAFYNSKTSQGLIVSNNTGTLVNINGINAQTSNILNSSYLNENTLTYKVKVNKKHVFDALAGFTYQYSKSFGYGFRSINIPQSEEQFGMLSLNTGIATTPLRVATHNQMFSTLGRFNYTYDNRYLFTLTARQDGTSKVQPGKQWGFFPSGAFAWNFSNESFYKGLKPVMNFGKLRASYGTIGNNRVNDFAYAYSFGDFTNAQGYPMYQGTTPYQGGKSPFFYGNSDITWEITKALDLGLSLGFFEDRITLEADYYNKKTTGALLLATLPATGGYSVGSSGQYQNMGDISNSGFEFTLNTVNISTKDFKWSSSFNITFAKNKILAFYDGSDVRQTPLALSGIPTANHPVAWVAKVGQPIAMFYGYKWGGVYQYEDFDQQANGSYVLKNELPTYSANVQPGDPKYVDLNKDGVVNIADQTIIGRGAPIHFGGFNNNFVYKNLSLNIFFQWNYGNNILNANRLIFEQGPFNNNLNQFATFANRWTPDNPTNDLPRARPSTNNQRGDAEANVPKISDRVIEDGSFLRLKTISLSFNMPTEVLKNTGIKGLRFNLSAQNLFTWTKYTGVDPETSTFRVANPANATPGTTGQSATAGTGYSFVQPSSGAPVLAPGLDYIAYPRALTVNFGAEINF